MSSLTRRSRSVCKWVLVIATLQLVNYSAATNGHKVSNAGRFFTFLPPGNGIPQGNGPVILITAEPLQERVKVQVDVSEAEFSKSLYLKGGEMKAVILPDTAMGRASGPQRGTVRIEASSPVTVQVMVNTGTSSYDGFLALPLQSLGMEYIASSTAPSRGQTSNEATAQSMLTITGVCKGTSSVSIKASSPLLYEGIIYKTGRTLRIMLEIGKSVQIQSNGTMTGTRVTSDKPVNVLLASTCLNDISEDLYCGYIVEQLSPVSALGKQFLLPGSSMDSTYSGTIQVLATRSSTTVQLVGIGLSRRLSRGEQWQLPSNQTTDQSTFLVADKPVQVTLCSSGSFPSPDCIHQSDCILLSSKTTMTTIPPLEQFTDSASFAVWNASSLIQESYHHAEYHLTVMVTSPCNDIAPQLVTTSDQSDEISWTKEVVSGTPSTCVLRAKVSPGSFHMDLKTQPVDATFAVLLHGIHGQFTYSMPVTTGGEHLGYVIKKSHEEQCIPTKEPLSCEETSCQNSGECIMGDDGSYRCSCISPVFQGQYCENVVELCSTYCLNGGNCTTSSVWPTCACPIGWAGDHCEYDTNAVRSLSNQGREFRITFMETPVPIRNPSIVILTSPTSINTTTVTVRLPSTGFIKTLELPPNKAETIELPVESVSQGSRQQHSGISVSASQDVTVYGFHNSILARDDGFLALPVQALGTKYVVIAPRQRKKRPHEKSQLAIVAAYNNTTVFIRTPVSVTFEGQDYASYSMIVAHLQEAEVVQLQSKFDLSEVEISSEHPVAVLSGSSCGYTMYDGSDKKGCRFMVEQLPPFKSWGKRFLVTPYLGNENGQTTLRIAGGPRQTYVSLGAAGSAHLYDGSMEEVYITEPTYITATNPVLIVAFSVQGKLSCSSVTNECEGMSMPTMSVVPHLDQVTTITTFTILPVATSTIHMDYISVIASNCSDITLMSILPQHNQSVLWDTSRTVLRTGGLCVLHKEIPQGLYQVSSISGHSVFSAQLYGFNDQGTAYGFPVTLGGQDNSQTELDDSTSPTEGRDFVLAFTSAGNYRPQVGPRLLITTTTDVPKTNIVVSGNELLIEITLGPKETRVVDIPPFMIAVNGHTAYPDVAIRVVSDHNITVVGMNDAYTHSSDEGYPEASDGFLALPVSALGTEYFIATPWPESRYAAQYMQFVIISLNNEAVRVDIKLEGTVWFDNSIYYGGSSMSISLHKMQSAFFKAYEDHFGTHVISSAPVAIISGCDCGYSYRTQHTDGSYIRSSCDHQVEFLTPVTRWGRKFLLAPLQGYQGGGYIVRFMAPKEFTIVKFDGTTHRLGVFQNDFQISVVAPARVVQSNLPVKLFAFTLYQPLTSCSKENGTCEGHSKPVLFTIPPIKSFKKKVTFPSYGFHGANDTNNFADIYTKCSEAAFILVNGAEQEWKNPLEEIEKSGYCVLRLQLALKDKASTYVVESVLEHGKLGVVTYGFSPQSGYAFPAGI